MGIGKRNEVTEFEFVTSHEIAGLLRCHPKTVDVWRREKGWIDGVHFTFYGRKYLYNRQLLLNLIQCGGDVESEEHQKAIAYYLNSQLHNRED